MSFTTEDEWSNAIQAVSDRLRLAEQQGYIIVTSPNALRALASECASLVIRCGDSLPVSHGDILDGEIAITEDVAMTV